MDITEEEITQEFSALGYEVKFVRQFQNSLSKFPIHMILLCLLSSHLLNSFSESFKTNKPAQCFLYQRFEHSNFCCGYPLRCVKISGSHLAKYCQKPRKADPKYSNCDGNHTANFTRCSSLLLEENPDTPLDPTQPSPHQTPHFRITLINSPPALNNPLLLFPILPSPFLNLL